MISLILLLQALHLLRSISSPIEAAIVTDGPLLPNPDLYVEPFNTAVSYRQDFCDLQSKFHNGEVELRTAFQGRQINVNIGYDSSVINFLEDGTIDPLEPGIMIEVLDEVARRGGFTWIDSFVYEQAPPPDKSWTDLLVWSIATYDISVNWWFTTPERVALGASFPTAWYDAAQIIVEKQDVDAFDSGFDLLFWAKPFNQGVWWTLLGTMVLTGFVFLYVEEGTLNELSHSDEDNPKPGSIVSLIITYIHKSFLVVTGHLEVSPATHAGQVVSFSMAFFAVLIVSAYTANLASFLVVQKASNVQINTVNDIIKIGGSICVYKSTAVEDELRGTYGNAILVPKDDDKDVMMGVANGDCDYGVLALASYELNKGITEVNADCSLRRVGRNFKDWEAGFASKSDAGTFCTSLVRDTFNVHLKDMLESGFIEEAWQRHNAEKHDISDAQCFSDGAVDSDSIIVFDITNLGGIFLLHIGAIVLACIIKFTSRRYDNIKKNRRENKSAKKDKDWWYDDDMDVIETKSMDKDEQVQMQLNELSNKIDTLTRNMEVLLNAVGRSEKIPTKNEKEEPLKKATSRHENHTTNKVEELKSKKEKKRAPFAHRLALARYISKVEKIGK